MNQGGQFNVKLIALAFLAASALVVLPLYYAAGQTQTSQTDNAKTGAAGSPADVLPDGAGKQVVLKSCQSCHSIRNVTSTRGTADDWAQVVSQMIGRGANISDDDADTIVEYLAAHYGPSSPKPAPSAPAASASEPTPPAAASAAASTASADQTGGSATTINVNKASAGELQSGLGLTEDQADAVVHYREQKGDFKNLQQLLSVPGIDAAKIKNEEKTIAF